LRADEVVVFQCDLLQRHGQLEQRIVVQAQLVEHLVAGLAHQLGARVVVLVDPVTEAHQLDAAVLVLHLVDELADLLTPPMVWMSLQHVQAGLVGTAVRGAPQAGHARSDGRKRVGARRAAQAHGGGGGVLLVVGVQDEDAVQRALDDRVDGVVFARRGEHHAHEVAGIAELVARVHVRLAGRILVRHGHQRGHLGDQADRRDLAVLRVVDVGAVVIEGRQGAHQAGHHRHRVRVAAEAAQEELHLLVDHGVVGHARREVLASAMGVGQVAVQQQVAGFQEVAFTASCSIG
jgi:hypothetical protein